MTRTTTKIWVAAAWISLLTGAFPVHLHAAEGITLDRAIRIALEKNPSLAATRSEVAAARARVTQATASYFPQVSASAGYDRTWNDAGGGPSNTWDGVDHYATGFSITQFITDFGKTAAQVERSSQNLQSIQNTLETVEKTLIKDVKQSYFEALKNQHLVHVRQEALDARKKHLEQARALYREGMRPRIDVTRGEVGVSQAQLRLVAERYGLQRSLIELEKLLGGPPKPGAYVLLEEEGPPSQTGAESKILPELNRLIDLALEQRPELLDLKAQIKSAEADLIFARRSAYPSLNARSSYQYFGDDFPLDRRLDQRWQVGMSLSWPLFTGFRQTGQVSESKAGVNRLNAIYKNRILAVTEEVCRAYLAVLEAEETIKTAKTALKQAEENLAMAEGRYRAGVSDTIELIDAQVLDTESRNAVLQAVYEYHKALAGLEFAAGFPLWAL